MKRWLKDLPIRTKLMLIACFASALAVVVSGAIHTFTDYKSGRSQLLNRMQMQATMAASNSSAAVAFDDADAAGRTLQALQADPAIRRAQIVRPDGTLFAERALHARR